MGHCIAIVERDLLPERGRVQLEAALNRLPAFYRNGWKVTAVKGAVFAVLQETSSDPVTAPFGWADGRFWGMGFGELYGSCEWNKVSDPVVSDMSLFCQHHNDQRVSLADCNGQFLVAYFDTLTQTLTVLNDRFGLNPLYYSREAERLVASTIVQGVIALRSKPPSLDPVSFLDFLAYGHLLGERTLLKDIALLPPACEFYFSSDHGIRIAPYWRPSFEVDPELSRDFEAALALFAERMTAAVEARCTTDSPVIGMGLSGGLDSRTVIGFAGSARDIRTFTYFGHPESADRPYALQISSLLGTEHKEIGFSPAQFINTLDEFLEASGAHCDVFFWVVQAFGYHLMADGVEVFLSGAGGDSLAGVHYDLWTYWSLGGKVERSLAFARANREGSSSRFLRKLVAPDFISTYWDEHRNRFEETFACCGPQRSITLVDRWMYFDLRQKQRRRINEGFRNYQRFVNARFPFYDYNVFDLFLSLPTRWKRRRDFYRRAMCRYLPALSEVPSTSTDNQPVSARKPDYSEVALLRTNLREWLPPPISSPRAMQSRNNPLPYWFSSELQYFFRERLLDGTLAKTHIIAQDSLEKLLCESQEAGQNVGAFVRLLTLHGAVNLLL